MNNINIPTIADFSDGVDFPLCSARLLKDAGSDVANQATCPNMAVTVIQGKLEYSHLFTMTGEGNDFTLVCKRHYNVAVRKPINVTFIRADLNTTNNKEDIMSTTPIITDEDIADERDWVAAHNITNCIAAMEGRPYTTQNLDDGTCWVIETCPETEEHAECHTNVMETIHETYGAACCDYEGCNHAYAITCLNHTPNNQENNMNTTKCPCPRCTDPCICNTPSGCGYWCYNNVGLEQAVEAHNYTGGGMDLDNGAAPELFIIAGTGAREIAATPDQEKLLFAKLVELLTGAKAKYGDRLRVLVGGAEGFDFCLAKAAKKLEIPFSVALPNETYGDYYWAKHSLTHTNRFGIFEQMCAAAHRVIHVCGKSIYGKNGKHANFIRNEYMVDKCNKVWVFMPETSGTRQTVAYTIAQGKPFYEVKLS